MTSEQLLVDAQLRAWTSNAERIETFFASLTDAQLEQEVAPGRNRLIYLLGHLAAVHDAMLPLLGIGSKLHPELAEPFLEKPDRAATTTLTAAELRRASSEIMATLSSAFAAWTPADWLARHTAVSEEDFRVEPHRNRYSVLVSRTAHMAFHYGQMVLTKPRGKE